MFLSGLDTGLTEMILKIYGKTWKWLSSNDQQPTWQSLNNYFKNNGQILCNPFVQTESLVASSENAQTSWLVCLYGHIQSLPILVCCPHMLQDGHHCSCIQEGKGNWTKWLLSCSLHFCHHVVLWESSQGSYHLHLTCHPRTTSIYLQPQ
jgi:hypothetical protein